VTPDPQDVEQLTDLLDLMADFPSNEQRARYLLTCNWMRGRNAAGRHVNSKAAAAAHYTRLAAQVGV
jgi:hypothetical protein